MNQNEKVMKLANLMLFVGVFLGALRIEPTMALAQGAETVIVIVGDSLTQGLGVKDVEAYPHIVEQLLKAKLRTTPVRVINAGISGALTAEADRKIRWYLKSRPRLIVLALGANDGMKGTPPDAIKANLAKAIDEAKSHQVTLVLAGMRMFTNLGSKYVKDFEAVYTSLAKEKSVPLIPFLLEGVALKKELNQADGRHPNAKGHREIAETVAQAILPLIQDPTKK